MKKSIFIAMFFFMASFLNVLIAQTLDDVLEKHFEAVGQQKLMETKTFEIKAKISQMGMEFPMEMKMKKPEMFLVTMTMQGQEMVQAFDGETGWMIAPWISAEPQALTGEQLKQAKEQASLEGELYNFEQKGSIADFVGKVNLDGKEAYKIKLSTSDGNTKDYYIDGKTYLISKVKAKISSQGQTVDVEQTMGDYKTIGGITLATKTETKSPMGMAVILMEEVKFDQPIDDAIFKQPVK